MSKLNLDEEQLYHLARLLMGAAYADDEFHGLERDAIQNVLGDFTDDTETRDAVIRRMADVDASTVDVEDAAEGLDIQGVEKRQEIFKCLTKVTDADFTLDFAESDFVQAVANALGASPHEYAGMIVTDAE